MKLNYSDYIKRSDASVLVSEAIFTQLSESYKSSRISEVAETTSGGTPSRNKATYYGGEIPWLKSGELNDGVIANAEEFITDEGLKNSSAKLHPKGTLLLAMYGATAGRTGILGIEAATNQAVCALYSKPIIERDFLFWFLRQQRFKFIEMSKGGAQPNISQGMIKETEIPMPPKTLQKQIAEILFLIESQGKIDIDLVPKEFRNKVARVLGAKNSVLEITTELTHQLSLVKQLRQQLLQEAVQGKLSTDQPIEGEAALAKQYGKLWEASGPELLAHIRAEKAKLVKEKKIKADKPLPPIAAEEMPFELPEGWVWVRLGEVALSATNGLYKHESYYKENGLISIRMYNIQDGKLNLSKVRRVLLENIEVETYRLETNDILVNRVNSAELIGKAAIVPEFHENLVFESMNIRLRLCFKEFIAPFINWILLESRARIYFTSTAKIANGQVSINQSQLFNLMIPLPPLQTQHSIVAQLSAYQGLCAALEAQIQECLGLNAALLQEVLREALGGGE